MELLSIDKYRNKVIKAEASSFSDDYKRSREIKAIRNTSVEKASYALIVSLDSENIGILVELLDNAKANRIKSVLDGKIQGDGTYSRLLTTKCRLKTFVEFHI